MPNWCVHDKWARKAGIDKIIANYVNKSIDFGLNWAILNENESFNEESYLKLQLAFLYEKDIEKKYSHKNSYVKACYLHYLLDYFRETRHDIHDLELIFEKFMQEKVSPEIINNCGDIINFRDELEELFRLLRLNKRELFDDLKGQYLLSLEKEDNDQGIGK